MPRKKPTDPVEPSALDYRYDAKRTNIPPAGLAAQGQVREVKKVKINYAYDAHRPPVLRFDTTGAADDFPFPELLKQAQERKLTKEEALLLAKALKPPESWLEWTGKREQQACEVDPIALHIHERVSTQAILKVAARQDIQRNLFADPELDYREAVKFYQHDIEWAKRTSCLAYCSLVMRCDR